METESPIPEPPIPVVDIRHLSVQYGRQMAVRDLSLTIPRGEVFGFIGPNGAGKTTTIKVLATLLKPTTGLVHVLGVNVLYSPQEVRRNIGYVPDSFGVYEDLTVAEYLNFFAAAYRIDFAKRAGTVRDVLALTDLSGKIDSQVDALSRGMKQRLGIARILLHDPQLLLLDEPASGLDPRARIELRELLKELQRMGKTILVSSHILHELAQFCTRIGIIEAGQMVAEGSLMDIYRKLDLKRTVHVQISNLSPPLVAAIQRVPGITAVEELADRVAIQVREDELAMEDLLDALRGLGARIRMFQPEAMDMETAFMKFDGRKGELTMAKQGIFRRFRLDWPLLDKELREQAARKQMYVVRVTYAVVLFGAFCFYYMRHLAEGAVFTLGRGMGPFQFLVTAQMVTIYLFLPPLMAGALAQEKERDTLGLLFLTDLTPWELILQKYFGRLIPMLTLLFLSLPLLAVAYSLGGVSAAMLYSSAAGLFLTCLWVGALALACSAYDATTFQALVRCWGMCVAFVMCCTLGPFPFWTTMAPSFGATPRGLIFLFPTFFAMICYLIVTWFCLARAKQVLESRAFVHRRNPFGQQFKHLDQYWKDMRYLIRAMLRERDREAHALANRVVRQGLGATGDEHGWSLGRFLLMRMQVPNVLAFGLIAGVIILIALVTNVALDPKSGGAFFVVVGGIWILGLLTVPIQSANAVASERMNERLGAILTTSLTAQEILHEWLGPVRRWIQFLVRPLIIIIVVEAIVKFKAPMNNDDPRAMNVALYLSLSLLTVLVYPALIQWSCLWIGLRVRNQIRALMTSLLVVAAWCLLPVTVAGYLVETGLLPVEWNGPLQFVSPVTIISTAEAIGRSSRSHGMRIDTDTMIIAFMHLGLAALLALVIRRHCLKNADRYLGRI